MDDEVNIVYFGRSIVYQLLNPVFKHLIIIEIYVLRS